MTTHTELLDLLPHRPPMRLVEEIVRHEPGSSACTRRQTRHDDWYFQGHFPNQPIVPAVALVELLAQTGGLAAHSGEQQEMRVAAIGRFKFPGAAPPGAVLEATATVVMRFGPLVRVEGRVTADGELVAEGEVTLAGVAEASPG